MTMFIHGIKELSR